MDRLFVGIDSGGSTSKLKARSKDGSIELSLVSAGANPKRIGFSVAADRLAELIARADSGSGNTLPLAIQIGAAGVGSSSDQAQLAVAVHERLSNIVGNERPVSVNVCTDADLALSAAFGTDSGVVVIAGTGSISICRATSGQVFVRGGWGFRLGDEGGGYNIGLEALRRLAADLENGHQCEMTKHIGDTFGLSSRDDLISFVYDQDRTAEVAPFVIQAAGLGDADAATVLDGAVSAICGMITRVGTSPDYDVLPRYALTGGLFREPHFRERVHECIRTQSPDWTTADPRLPSAVDAAMAMATQLS